MTHGSPDVVRIEDVSTPAPSDGEILIGYPFRNAREALRYVTEGHQRGKVVIVLES